MSDDASNQNASEPDNSNPDDLNPDRDYFYKRAEAELAMAQKTAVPEAVKAHYLIAGYYLDRVYGDTGLSDRSAPRDTHIAED